MSEPTPDQIKAIASTADLLAAIERFEAVGCDFGGASIAYIKAFTADRHRATFSYKGVEFETAGFPSVLLVLVHAARPKAEGEGETLRPFAELLVTQNIRQVRLVSLNQWQAHLEVVRQKNWVKLTPKEAAPAPPPTPTEVPDAASP